MPGNSLTWNLGDFYGYFVKNAKKCSFWWDKLLQVCGWLGTTFRVGKRSPVQGETVRSVKNKEERSRSEKWKRYYDVPNGLKAIEGQILADVKLPKGFTWDKDATTSVGAAGDQEFTVTYTPDDTDNFKVAKENKVTIKVHMKWLALNEIPVINATDKTLTEGDKFDPKEGVTASDKEDGDLTDQIKIADNTVNTSKAGIYSVTYQVTDKDGATATKTINVVVKAKAVPPATVKQDGSTKTGDVSSPYFWAVVAIIALIGAAVTLLIKRKGIRSH